MDIKTSVNPPYQLIGLIPGKPHKLEGTELLYNCVFFYDQNLDPIPLLKKTVFMDMVKEYDTYSEETIKEIMNCIREADYSQPIVEFKTKNITLLCLIKKKEKINYDELSKET